MIKITVSGERREIKENTTVEELLSISPLYGVFRNAVEKHVHSIIPFFQSNRVFQSGIRVNAFVQIPLMND